MPVNPAASQLHADVPEFVPSGLHADVPEFVPGKLYSVFSQPGQLCSLSAKSEVVNRLIDKCSKYLK